MFMRVALTEFDRDGCVLQSYTVMIESVQVLNDFVERHRLHNAVIIEAATNAKSDRWRYEFEVEQGK
jgi:hypothetical protein